MSAVLRVFWLFYTAFPIQRWLAVVGAVIGGVLIVVDLLSSETRIGIAAGVLIFTILTAFPAMVAGAALLRALSAPRSHQLFSYFRLRALFAAALLVASLALWFGVVLAAPALLVGRAVPPAVVVFPFGFVTAVFIWTWLFSGDWRWAFAFLLLPVGVITLVRTGPGAPDAGSLPVIPVLIGASLAWVVFGVWYLRVRLVRPLMLKRASRDVVPWAETPTRNAATRAVLTWNGYPGILRPLLTAIGAGGGAGIALLVIAFLSQKLIAAPFISGFIWSFVCMTMAGGLTARVASQSRLLWLTIEGNRDDIRRLIERAAWRGGLTVLIALVVFALVVVLPLGGSARELILGLAVCSSATCYGVYVALAAPQTSRTQILGFGLMALAQIALIARANPTVSSVAIVIAAQLLGAALFRLLAVRRWRHIDWHLLRPRKGLEGVP